jgi:hypothetical protein
MNAKETWPVVKFIIAATGFKRQDARKMLEEIPDDRYSRLFLMARAWDREQSQAASKALEELLGNDSLKILHDATKQARKPSTEQGGDDDEEDDKPARKARKKAR